MLFDTPLTEKEKAHPHKAVMDNRRSMSVLERSFYRQRFEQIQQWDEMGVVAQAMSGQVPRVRRPYSKSLMDFLVLSGPLWWQEDERKQARAKTLQRLWDLGASNHSDRFDAWFMGCLGDDFANQLLDAGANPHVQLQVGGFRKHAVIELAEGIMKCERWTSPGNLERALRQAVDLRALFDRCLDTPGASQEDLDDYLGKVIRMGHSAPVQAVGWWRQAAERLLAMGARPSFAEDKALTNFMSPRFPDRGVLWFANAVAAEEARVGHKLSEGEEQGLGRRLAWREMLRSGKSSRAALRALLPHRDTWVQARGQHLHEYYWDRLLMAPGGVWAARKLLSAGTPAPWHHNAPAPSQGHRSSPSLVASHWERNPALLRRFARAVDPASIDPRWAEQMRTQYLAQDKCAIGRRGACALHKAEELTDLLRVFPVGGVLPPEVSSWMTRLPEVWDRNETPFEERRDMARWLHAQGLLQRMLGVGRDGPLATRFPDHARAFARAWRQAVAELGILETYPALEKDWTLFQAAAHLGHREQNLMMDTLRAALVVAPEEANALWEYANEQFKERSTQDRVRMQWWMVAGLRQGGWNFPGPEDEKELIWQSICSVDQAWGENAQHRLVADMRAAGADLDADNCHGLRKLLASEAQLPNSPLAMACMLPLVTAMIDHSINLALLPEVEAPDRPLGCVVQVARDHLLLQRGTCLQSSGPRQRRL